MTLYTEQWQTQAGLACRLQANDNSHAIPHRIIGQLCTGGDLQNPSLDRSPHSMGLVIAGQPFRLHVWGQLCFMQGDNVSDTADKQLLPPDLTHPSWLPGSIRACMLLCR